MFMSAGIGLLFFVVALFYSMAGFGGGSTYTALLIFSKIDYRLIPIISLSCNLIVTLQGGLQFYKKKYVRLNQVFLWVTLAPFMAFLGGLIPISAPAFKGILGGSLILGSLFLLDILTIPSYRFYSRPLFAVISGGLLGLLAGVSGIGGGIFLSPLLHSTKQYEAKTICGICSFFILINGVSGLAGHIVRHRGILHTLPGSFILLPAAVLIGGFIGNRLAREHFSPQRIKQISAGLVGLAGVQILSRLVF